jgi:hypothetical protein
MADDGAGRCSQIPWQFGKRRERRCIQRAAFRMFAKTMRVHNDGSLSSTSGSLLETVNTQPSPCKVPYDLRARSLRLWPPSSF